MHDYEVVIGGYGAAYSGSDRTRAKKAYRKAVNRCLDRQLNISVVLFKDGYVVREHDGEFLNAALTKVC